MSAVIGLDIGSHNIKLIELENKGSTSTLLSAGSMPTPPKSVSSTLSVDEQSLIFVIQTLIKETGAKASDVNIALPESQVFTRVIEVPSLSQRELSSAIRWEAEQYIPMPIDQVNIDYTILRDARDTATGKMDVLLVAAPKTLVNRYMNIIDQLNLTPISAETEIIASSRALVRSTPTLKYIMVVSFGAQTTDIAIIRSGIILFTRSVAAGGDSLSRALTQTLDFNLIQAEEYKKTYGLSASVLEGKLLTAFRPIMDTIIEEIRRAIGFFEEKQKGDHIEAILLSGGSAKLPGLVPFIAESLGVEVQIANPWVGITKDNRFSILNSEGPLFSVAVGLALRTA
jgi:type IV pilus assembly protein PilM